eukprot:TRINITY_DN3167_c0_g1_i1.p6 TRINITY_DN3167_c0_g1~~TRINITY_DN3167_c0_g1_i1.p6  ORF type:complete len:56 (+),score=5.61 TRINITY_DN3167_c0_g1_i1:253-420(+)
MFRRLYEAFGSPQKERVEFPESGHNDCAANMLFWMKVQDFVARAAGKVLNDHDAN